MKSVRDAAIRHWNSSRPIAYLLLALILIGCAPATPIYPTSRPTFAFPTGTPIPVTSGDGQVIEQEAGPLYVILSTADDHGLIDDPTMELMGRPDPASQQSVAEITTGTFAQVFEIRRLPPDFLRTFYRVRVRVDGGQEVEGWLPDWNVHRTVFVVAFDAQGCACPFQVPMFQNEQLKQPGEAVTNRSPLRLLAMTDSAVQVQVLSNGAIGWLDRNLVHESEENEFIKRIAPVK